MGSWLSKKFNTRDEAFEMLVFSAEYLYEGKDVRFKPAVLHALNGELDFVNPIDLMAAVVPGLWREDISLAREFELWFSVIPSRVTKQRFSTSPMSEPELVGMVDVNTMTQHLWDKMHRGLLRLNREIHGERCVVYDVGSIAGFPPVLDDDGNYVRYLAVKI